MFTTEVDGDIITTGYGLATKDTDVTVGSNGIITSVSNYISASEFALYLQSLGKALDFVWLISGFSLAILTHCSLAMQGVVAYGFIGPCAVNILGPDIVDAAIWGFSGAVDWTAECIACSIKSGLETAESISGYLTEVVGSDIGEIEIEDNFTALDYYVGSDECSTNRGSCGSGDIVYHGDFLYIVNPTVKTIEYSYDTLGCESGDIDGGYGGSPTGTQPPTFPPISPIGYITVLGVGPSLEMKYRNITIFYEYNESLKNEELHISIGNYTDVYLLYITVAIVNNDTEIDWRNVKLLIDIGNLNNVIATYITLLIVNIDTNTIAWRNTVVGINIHNATGLYSLVTNLVLKGFGTIEWRNVFVDLNIGGINDLCCLSSNIVLKGSGEIIWRNVFLRTYIHDIMHINYIVANTLVDGAGQVVWKNVFKCTCIENVINIDIMREYITFECLKENSSISLKNIMLLSIVDDVLSLNDAQFYMTISSNGGEFYGKNIAYIVYIDVENLGFTYQGVSQSGHNVEIKRLYYKIFY